MESPCCTLSTSGQRTNPRKIQTNMGRVRKNVGRGMNDNVVEESIAEQGCGGFP